MPAMVAAGPGAAKASARPDPSRRLPLIPSEKDNAAPTPRRPRPAREVTSRYMSSVSSSSSSSSSSSAPTAAAAAAAARRRCPSPMVGRAPPDLPAQKRAQSAERRRQSFSDTPAAAKALWASTATTTRRLSVSFQGESFSLPVKKPAPPSPAPSPAAERRRSSPLRGKPGECQSPRKSESSRMSLEQQHRWPARLRSPSFLTKSLDHSAAEKIGALVAPIRPDFSADVSTSDTESVSSGSNSESTPGSLSRLLSRGLAVPARFWQESNSRHRRLQDSSPSPSQIKKAFPESPRRLPSPLKASPRPASPSRLSTLSPRGNQSPARPRPTPTSGSAPSLLSFASEMRRGKMGETRVEQAHVLRLLHNRHLQWRFANARLNAAFLIQCQTSVRHLYSSWLATSELRELVARKRIQLLSQRLNLKLSSILLGQMPYLEIWSLIESDNLDSLTELIQDLKASTLRLPITEGAQADMIKVKDAIGSAVDVIHAMESSVNILLTKVRDTNILATKLVSISEQERILLAKCKSSLSSITAMQVEEASLRSYLTQLRRHSPDVTQM